MKILKLFLLINCIFLWCDFSWGLEGRIDYDSVYIDYSILEEGEYLKSGDNFLIQAEKASNSDVQRKFYYTQALGAYTTAVKINPNSVTTYGKIGYIYGKTNQYSLAKTNFQKGLNLQMYNPFVNFLFACFYADNQNYNNALRYYKRALKANFADSYALYYNIGETNEKLGDLVKAIEYYKKADLIKPSNELKEKIKSIESLKYDKSPYYERKKLFYYN